MWKTTAGSKQAGPLRAQSLRTAVLYRTILATEMAEKQQDREGLGKKEFINTNQGFVTSCIDEICGSDTHVPVRFTMHVFMHINQGLFPCSPTPTIYRRCIDCG